MIYLIGGPVRVGKSRLAKMALERRGIGSITTDALTNSIGRTIPETRLAGSDIPQEEWEMNFYPFLRRFIKTISFDYADFLLEGAVISPEVVNKLSKKFETRCVFVGDSESSVEQLKRFMGSNIWLRTIDDAAIDKVAEQIRNRSFQLESACGELDYPYVDLAGEYKSKIEIAYQHLVRESSVA